MKVILILLISYPLFAIEHLRVVFRSDPAHMAHIMWTQKDSQIDPSVTIDGVLNQKNAPQIIGKIDRKNIVAWHLTDLKADQAYTIHYQDEKTKKQSAFFKTAPEGPNARFKLLFGGDSRTDRTMRRRMNKMMQKYLEKEDILALVHGGDFISNGRNMDQWQAWLTDHAAIKTKKGRLLPIIATRGNHEYSSKIFSKIFAFPTNDSHFYITHIGDYWYLLNLNTEISTGGRQKQWLETNLRHLKDKATFILANYHRPAFPAVKRPSAARSHWVPLFDKYNLDLVFESDGHVYKQTRPIRYGRYDKDGVVYVGEGGLGVKMRTPYQAWEWYFQEEGMAKGIHHIQILEVSPGKMTYRPIPVKGSLPRLTLRPKKR